MPYDASFNGIASMVAVMLLLTSTTLTLRLVARYKQKALFGADDILAIMAWLVFLGAITVGIYGMSIKFLGFTTPSKPKLVPRDGASIGRALLSGLLFAILTLGFARLSAVVFFRRIFCTKRMDTFDIVTRIMIAVISLWTLGFFLSTLLSCGSNIAGWWGQNNVSVCIIYPNQKGIAVSSFILDFLVLVLPLPKIWMLRTTLVRKVAISAVFLMGLSSLIASCTRMVILFLSEDKGAAANNLDPLGVNTRNYFYQLFEAGSCLTAINLPFMWYFFSGLTPEKVLRSLRSIVSLRSTSSRETIEEKTSSVASTYNEAVPSKRAHHELENHETPKHT